MQTNRNIGESPSCLASPIEKHKVRNDKVSSWELVWQSIAARRRRRQTSSISKTDERQAANGNIKIQTQWRTILLGQLVALLASSSNAASFTLMNSLSVETQFLQLTGLYLLLSLHLMFRKQTPRNEEKEEDDDDSYALPGTRLRLRIPWWIYLFMSLLDVLPNFLTLLSFRYTSLTSTTLLGSLTVPSAMICSRYILTKQFGVYHYLGVCLCVLGGSLTVWVDQDAMQNSNGGEYEEESLPQEEEGSSTILYQTFSSTTSPTIAQGGIASHALMGDILAITAAIIYGLGDTVAEYCIKHIDRREYLGMLGLFGIIQSLCFTWWLEGDKLRQLTFLPPNKQLRISGVLLWYTTSVFGYYLTEARFLLVSDATLLNLSLQAANLWAILFSIVAYRALPPLLFYAALVLVASGVFVYEIHGTRRQDSNTTNYDSSSAVQEEEEEDVGEHVCETVSLKLLEGSPLIESRMVAGRINYQSIA